MRSAAAVRRRALRTCCPPAPGIEISSDWRAQVGGASGGAADVGFTAGAAAPLGGNTGAASAATLAGGVPAIIRGMSSASHGFAATLSSANTPSRIS